MATYTPSLQQNLGFLYTLQSLKPHSPDEAVTQVWQQIVTERFSPHGGHKYRFDVSSIGVIAVIPILANNENAWFERDVFLVECKRPSSDTTELNWSDTVNNQFREDLSSTSE